MFSFILLKVHQKELSSNREDVPKIIHGVASFRQEFQIVFDLQFHKWHTPKIACIMYMIHHFYLFLCISTLLSTLIMTYNFIRLVRNSNFYLKRFWNTFLLDVDIILSRKIRSTMSKHVFFYVNSLRSHFSRCHLYIHTYEKENQQKKMLFAGEEPLTRGPEGVNNFFLMDILELLQRGCLYLPTTI